MNIPKPTIGLGKKDGNDEIELIPLHHHCTVAMTTRYMVLAGLGVMLILIGIILAPSITELLEGYAIVLSHPSLTDFDGFMWAGNFGTSFVNAGIILLLVLIVFWFTDTDIEGMQIAAALVTTGFSFYGKNVINIWFPVIGVFLYANWIKRPFKEISALAFFSTALAPVFSVTAFATDWLPHGGIAAVSIGALLGIFSGILVVIFADYLPNLHQGRLLYNAGFAAGIVGVIINAVQRVFNLGFERYPYLDENFVTGENHLLFFILAIICSYFVIVGIALGGFKNFKRLVWRSCYGGDFVREFGFAATIINMGTVGLVCCGYVFLTVTGQFNGPVYACVLTAAGFSAAGVTLRMLWPTMTGVYLTSFFMGGINSFMAGGSFLAGAFAKTGSRGMVLSAIYSCGIAPSVGAYGWLSGVFIGATHSLLVTMTGAMHGWRSLYNNAFSLGLIAVFGYPLFSRVSLRKREKIEKIIEHTDDEITDENADENTEDADIDELLTES
ncbi:DUF1576 domain-containing protein [Tyzzerella sp. OttesenSCG-928-J15]|nr:DUF1576 domain-containing protein [Tyzzerella sp. OttesenSCG-928-J15]